MNKQIPDPTSSLGHLKLGSGVDVQKATATRGAIRQVLSQTVQEYILELDPAPGTSSQIVQEGIHTYILDDAQAVSLAVRLLELTWQVTVRKEGEPTLYL